MAGFHQTSIFSSSELALRFSYESKLLNVFRAQKMQRVRSESAIHLPEAYELWRRLLGAEEIFGRGFCKLLKLKIELLPNFVK
jgi:hypothetical protein